MNLSEFPNDILYSYLQNDSAPPATLEQAATILSERYRNDGSSIARHRMKLIRTTLEILGKSSAPKPQFAIALPSQKKASQPVMMPTMTAASKQETESHVAPDVVPDYGRQLKRLSRKIHVAVGMSAASLLFEFVKEVIRVLYQH